MTCQKLRTIYETSRPAILPTAGASLAHPAWVKYFVIKSTTGTKLGQLSIDLEQPLYRISDPPKALNFRLVVYDNSLPFKEPSLMIMSSAEFLAV